VLTTFTLLNQDGATEVPLFASCYSTCLSMMIFCGHELTRRDVVRFHSLWLDDGFVDTFCSVLNYLYGMKLKESNRVVGRVTCTILYWPMAHLCHFLIQFPGSLIGTRVNSMNCDEYKNLRSIVDTGMVSN
jgi:hypothetical protein